MAVGRRSTAQHDYQAAFEAYTEALRAKPADALAWAELGYAALLAGKNAAPALLRARSLTSTPKLLAQIWWNEAQFRQKRGDAAAARIALVIAEANGSKAATRALGSASRCAATWTTDPKELEDIEFAKSFLDVFSRTPFMCHEAAPQSEAEAKQVVCFGCQGFDAKGESDECSGPGPWHIQTGYQHFHVFSLLVQPLTGGRYYVEPYADGGAPSPIVLEAGSWVRESLTAVEDDGTIVLPDGATMTNLDRWSDDQPDSESATDDDSAHCAPSLASEVRLGEAICAQCGYALFPFRGARVLHYHHPDTGRERLRVTVYQGDVRASLTDGEAHITGGGCDATVPLH